MERFQPRPEREKAAPRRNEGLGGHCLDRPVRRVYRHSFRSGFGYQSECRTDYLGETRIGHLHLLVCCPSSRTWREVCSVFGKTVCHLRPWRGWVLELLVIPWGSFRLIAKRRALMLDAPDPGFESGPRTHNRRQMTADDCVWLAPPTNSALPNDEVHVWRADLDRPGLQLRRMYGMLSADEQQRAGRFRFDRDGSRFIARRSLLRIILGRYLGLEPGSLRFCYGPNGKPALEKECSVGGLLFNMSHSQGLAVYGVSRKRKIGVDIEYVRPIPESDQIAGDLFSSEEYAVYRGLPSREKCDAFMKCWTLREACVKASGEGLAGHLSKINVSRALRRGVRVLNIISDTRAPVLWSLRILTPASGYAAALAVEGCGWRLVCWQQLEEANNPSSLSSWCRELGEHECAQT